MNLTSRVLVSIKHNEPTTFHDLVQALGSDAPLEGDRAGWRIIFETIDAMEQCALADVTRAAGRFRSAQLTILGAERARETREHLKKENSFGDSHN